MPGRTAGPVDVRPSVEATCVYAGPTRPGEVLGGMGEDPARYDLWRFRQMYPVPNSVRVWWLELA